MAIDPRSSSSQRAAASRFQLANAPVARRLIMSVFADEKCGKSHFAFTAPGPIGCISIDYGIDGVIQKFQDEKQIKVSKYRLKIPPKGADMNQVASASVEMWDDILEDFHYSIANHRTTVVDTGDEAWAILRLARFGKLDQVKPHHYGPVNAEFRDLYREAYDGPNNLIMLHKSKAEYVDDRKTGKKERAGFSDTGFLVQVELKLSKLPLDDRDDASDNGFRGRIISCRQNPDIEGQELQGPMLSFPIVAQIVFPDSSASDWE